MSNFRNQLKQTDEYQEIVGQAQEAVQDQQQVETVSEAVEPVVSFEKGDLQFWMQVATLLLLFAIYRELARANGRAVAQGIANGVSA